MSLTQINKAGLDEIALDHVFTIGASGTDHYTFQGEGLNGTVNDPTLYLTRGKTYRFENTTGGHPIRIQSTSGASGTAYNTGVTNNASAGTVIVEVQHDAPDVLYYQCTSHPNMNGILYITGALADGGVTTAKLADDAVTDAKLANSINAAIAANTAKTSNATHTGDVTGSTSLTIADNAVTQAKIAAGAIGNTELANGAVSAAKIGSGAVTAAKIGSGAVGSSQLADQGVTLAKLEHGTSSNDGKFLRANNGADPTFETVNTDLVSDTSPQLGGSLDVNDYNILNGTAILDITENQRFEFNIGGTEYLDVNGGGIDVNGKATFPDGNSNGVVIGDGSDLKLFHNGSHSYVENTEGVLHITNTNDIKIQTGGGANELAIDCNSNGSVDLYYDHSKKLETYSDGVKVTGVLRGTTNGFGIDFAETGNTSGMSSEVFDDYEEGSFTPRLGGTGNPGSYYVTGTGTYIKIGRQVTVSIRFNSVDLSNSASGTVQIFNMPFTGGHRPSNGACGVTSDVLYYNVPFDTGHLPAFYLSGNTTIWYGLLSRSNISWADFPVSDFHSSVLYVMFSGTYFTDS